MTVTQEMNTKLVLLVFGIAIAALNATAQVKKSKTPSAANNLQSIFRERYCHADEKVGMALNKNLKRPGLADFRKLKPEQLTDAVVKPFMALAERGFKNPEIRSIQVWVVTPSAGSEKWLLANLKLDSQDSGEEGGRFAFCAFTAIQPEDQKLAPQALFSPCVYSQAPRNDPRNSEMVHLAPDGLRPYDSFDLDGDGWDEIVLKETAGYSQALHAFKLKNGAWQDIIKDCAGGD